MKRDDFVAKFTSLIIQQSNRWLPEESTEEDMYDVMEARLREHKKSIKSYLKEE